MKSLVYRFFKGYVKIGLFFFNNKTRVIGLENIPKKGAILYTINHPNGLIDSLNIVTKTPRKCHFLVKADVFKKPIIVKFFSLLNMNPIYRIRDGLNTISKNQEIFERCHKILHNQEALMIFPEGSHNVRRTVRVLKKGFTRILFGTFDKYPDLQIHVVPIGITYQNPGSYPSKVCFMIGKPILANKYYNSDELNMSIKQLKEVVYEQLKELCVHIPDDENYANNLKKLENAQVDFTDVAAVNAIIKNGNYPQRKKASKNYLKILFYLIGLNSPISFIIWKMASKNIENIEFVDTFKFGLNVISFPLLYSIQSSIIAHFFGWKVAGIYFISSLLLLLLYTKTAPTPPKSHLE